MRKKHRTCKKLQSAISPLESTKSHTGPFRGLTQQKKPLRECKNQLPRSQLVGTGSQRLHCSTLSSSALPKTLLTLLLLLRWSPRWSQSLWPGLQKQHVCASCSRVCFRHVHHLSYQHTYNIYPDLITIHPPTLRRCRSGLFIVLSKHVALSGKERTR